jgi:hypothetical protein
VPSKSTTVKATSEKEITIAVRIRAWGRGLALYGDRGLAGRHQRWRAIAHAAGDEEREVRALPSTRRPRTIRSTLRERSR